MNIMNLKNSLTLAAVALATLGVGAAGAATNYVTPGTTIQDAVNASVTGDTIVIFGGNYNEDVTVTGKQLSLQRLTGQSVFITGSLTWNNVGAAAGTPLTISNLKIGGDGSKRLTVNNSTNVVIDNVDLALSGLAMNNCSNVVVNNSALGIVYCGSLQNLYIATCTSAPVNLDNVQNAVIANCTLQNATGNNTGVTFSRCTINDIVSFNNASTTNRALNVLQCTITNNEVSVTRGYARLLYSTLRKANMYDASSVILGNVFRTQIGNQIVDGVVRLENGVSQVSNNDISARSLSDFFHGKSSLV